MALPSNLTYQVNNVTQHGKTINSGDTINNGDSIDLRITNAPSNATCIVTVTDSAGTYNYPGNSSGPGVFDTGTTPPFTNAGAVTVTINFTGYVATTFSFFVAVATSSGGGGGGTLPPVTTLTSNAYVEVMDTTTSQTLATSGASIANGDSILVRMFNGPNNTTWTATIDDGVSPQTVSGATDGHGNTSIGNFGPFTHAGQVTITVNISGYVPVNYAFTVNAAPVVPVVPPGITRPNSFIVSPNNVVAGQTVTFSINGTHGDTVIVHASRVDSDGNSVPVGDLPYTIGTDGTLQTNSPSLPAGTWYVTATFGIGGLYTDSDGNTIQYYINVFLTQQDLNNYNYTQNSGSG